MADRRRMRERFRASLAGLLELEVLRSKHRAMVDGALGKERAGHLCWAAGESANNGPGDYRYNVLGSSTGSLRLTRSLSSGAVPQHQHHYQQKPPLRGNAAQADARFRASSGFCDDDAERFFLSSSCSSLCSRPLELRSGEDEMEWWRRTSTPVSTLGHVIPSTGFLSVADLCPESHWWHVSTILRTQVTLDPVYLLDLVAGQSQEVYQYPSPLHAVALQSPIYTPAQRPCSLPACLSEVPWRSGWSPAPRPEMRRPEKISELAYRRRWPVTVESDASSSFSSMRHTYPSGGREQWPVANRPTLRGKGKRAGETPKTCGRQQDPNPTGEEAEPWHFRKHRPTGTCAAAVASVLR
ncbi:hypothetical protein AAFF_G00039280 [Aldrovandia affinis]|uniref:Uncharacterized protein n=1 Tax=Aldrovandia affinis TaxID=143900 RepID=A0AAD7WFD2_9TELE|nr:hypothetical protein AAFF_G00039280 [Aldrovandia affinis]